MYAATTLLVVLVVAAFPFSTVAAGLLELWTAAGVAGVAVVAAWVVLLHGVAELLNRRV
jgi:hypothetical protein